MPQEETQVAYRRRPAGLVPTRFEGGEVPKNTDNMFKNTDGQMPQNIKMLKPLEH